MIKTVCSYFFIFVIFSVTGWIIETLLFALRDKKFVKRGFLFGPICPIYGVGAVICTAILYNRVTNFFLVFIFGLLICGVLEYATHFIMEKLFNAVWWDYSDRRFNIKGRVYLKGLLFFGAGAVLIIKVLQPLVAALLGIMSDTVLYSICFAVYSVFIVDLAVTLADLKGTVKSIKSIQNFAISTAQKGLDITDDKIQELLESVKETSFVLTMMEKLNSKGSFFTRIQRIFPNFTLQQYKHVIDMLSYNPQSNNQRKDIKHYGTSDSIPGSETPDIGENSDKT